MAPLSTLQPDFVVLDHEFLDPKLAVEVKARALSPAELEKAEARLHAYMVAVDCPVGAIVTPERLLLYRNRFRGTEVARIGDFNQPVQGGWPRQTGLGADSPSRELLYERIVQDWFDGLVIPGTRGALELQLGDALEEWVVPALLKGELAATGPRAAWEKTVA